MNRQYKGKGRPVRRLDKNWTSMFAEEVNSVHSGCVLAFKSHRVKAGGSRKISGPFLVASAICKGINCHGNFLFIIDEEPADNVDVNIRCEVSGSIQHEENEVNRRHISGKRREETAEEILKSSTCNVFNANIVNCDKQQLEHGNYTNVPNLTVMRKIIAEHVKKETLHNNIFAELQLLKETFETENEPYIQEIGLDPFYLMLYSKKQISVLRNLSSKNELNLYVDATGSIITNIPGQKRPYLYSLVVKPDTELPPVSVADMVSTSHTVPRISFFLSHVKRAVGLTGKDLNIKKIETDFSYAIIQACVETFNHLNLKQYLIKCFHIVRSGVLPENFTVLHLCGRHVLQDFMRQLLKSNPTLGKSTRKFVYRAFVALQGTSSLESAINMYSDICTIFLSPQITPEVKKACGNVIRHSDDDEDMPEVGPTDTERLEEEEVIISGNQTLKQTSPFTPIFDEKTQEVKQQMAVNTGMTENDLHCPGVIECLINKFLYTIPLWSGMMISLIKVDNGQKLTRDTNSFVENWFKYIKHDITTRKRDRPSKFVIRNRQTVHGRLLEHEYPGSRKTVQRKRKRQNDADLSIVEEIWKPKAKKKKTTVKKTAKNVSKVSTGKYSELPAVAKWGGQIEGTNLVNTCTIDNALTILHLKFVEQAAFQTCIMNQNSATSETLLTVFKLMSEKEFTAAKVVWLNHVHKDVSADTNLFGDESEFFAGYFQREWITVTTSRCFRQECPRPYAASKQLQGISIR